MLDTHTHTVYYLVTPVRDTGQDTQIGDNTVNTVLIAEWKEAAEEAMMYLAQGYTASTDEDTRLACDHMHRLTERVQRLEAMSNVDMNAYKEDAYNRYLRMN